MPAIFSKDNVDSVGRDGIAWWARQDSNLGRIGYEPRALPLSYGPGFGGQGL